MIIEARLIAPESQQRPWAALSSWRRIVLFVLLAYGLAWALELLLMVLRIPAGSEDGSRLSLSRMEGCCARPCDDHCRLTAGRRFSAVDLRPRVRQGWRWYLIACAPPVVLVALASAFTVLLGQGGLDWTLPGSLPGSLPVLTGQTLPSALLAQTVLMGSLLGIPFGMGEELGWRGFSRQCPLPGGAGDCTHMPDAISYRSEVSDEARALTG